MTLENIFYISQSVASIAVVGSLIYLGVQVRYAERCQRGIMQQARADRSSQAALKAADSDLARVWQKGAAGESDITPLEFTQWMLLCRAAFLAGEDSVMQHKAGLLAPSAYESYVAGVRHFMAQPGFRAAWKILRTQFGREFRAFGDSTLEQTSVANVADAYVEWKRLVQSTSAAEPQTTL